MPMDVVRILDSDLFALSTGDEFKAALALWCKAWLQIPAASLPDDDRVLAHLSGAGSKWKKIRDAALRNWIKCSDGRLYHPTVAEKALEAWKHRLAQRERANKRWGGSKDAAGDDATAMPRHNTGNASAADPAMQGTGTVKGRPKPSPTVNHESPKPSLARDEPPDGIAWTGELALNYVCQAAGWWPGDNQRGAAIGTINGWLEAGCSMKLILAGIGLALKRNPEPTKSLKRFDSTIRGMRRDQLGGELPHTTADIEALTSGVAKRMAVGG